MPWRIPQNQSRLGYLEKYTAKEVASYDQWITSLTAEDHEAYLQDILDYCPLLPGLKILDLGAGTGALCSVLKRIGKIELTALEPSPEMIRRFQSKPDLADIQCVQAFCDHEQDQTLFPPATFDAIASRQLFNGLYDPLSALRNSFQWLKPNGYLIVTDGFYDRSAWTGIWEEEVDRLPLSACRNIAMVPYLAEQVGFQIVAAKPMTRTNQRPSTRTPRYIIVGIKPSLTL